MSDGKRTERWSGPLIDAYAHVGRPRYGSLENAERFFARLGIRRAVLVLGPGMPDLASLRRAYQRHGGDVRLMGIPFGRTESQRRELAEIQIRLGISGMRLMPFEIEPNRPIIGRLGQEGLWLFAINPQASPQTTGFLLEWLERHPSGRVAAPHFLAPGPPEERAADPALFEALLRHRRFHGILSRHGGVGSAEPYPHPDLRPWVERLAELMSWRRLMWGSEFPIIYQRNERPEEARDWLLNLGLELPEEEREAFYAGNARRLFFEEPPPAPEEVDVPDWVEQQTDREAKVYQFPNNRLFLPMRDYDTLLTDYLEACEEDPGLRFAQYLAGQLSRRAAELRGD